MSVVAVKETVNHPEHYSPGVYEVINIIEHYKLGFHLGNTVKYVLRADRKGARIEDLKKARWYLDREIANHEQLMAEALQKLKAEDRDREDEDLLPGNED